MNIVRHFLGWDRPVVALVAERLCRGWATGCLDLSRVMIVVPTRQSGRRLLSELAGRAAARSTGLLSPQIVTAEYLIQPLVTGLPIAGGIVATAVWLHVLLNAGPATIGPLFPEPAGDDHAWALGLAGRLSGLRSLIAENGLTLGDVSQRFSEAGQEPERWQALARLEQAYLDKLEKLGLEDAVVAKLRMASEAPPLRGVERLVVAAHPDPLPQVLKVLELVALHIPVEVWVHAPRELAEGFDGWGRPSLDFWKNRRQITFPTEDAMRLCGDPQAMSREMLGLLSAAVEPREASSFAVAALNASLLPFVQDAFARQGVKTYDPEGLTLEGTALYHLLSAMSATASRGTYDDFAALLRNADFLRFLGARLADPGGRRLLCELDTFQNRHLPAGIAEIAAFLDVADADHWQLLRQAHAIVRDLVDRYERQPLARFFREFLGEVYGQQSDEAAVSDGGVLVEAAESLNTLLGEIESLSGYGLDLAGPVLTDILLGALRQKRVYPEHPIESVAVQGWLELHWEPAPTLILAGFNEGFVPEAVVGDLFLPDLSRSQLGLQSNDQRFARDAYLLSAMLSSRSAGQLLLLVAKTDAAGDPLKPSRLLFQCDQTLLLERCRKLFGQTGPAEAELVVSDRQWLLTPRIRRPAARLHVTAFRDYLACPFRFYLRHGLGMQKVDDAKNELDDLDFGVASHHAFELLAGESALAQCSEPHVLADFLVTAARQRFGQTYGIRPPLVVSVQLESLCERLTAAAEVEAQLRRQGWSCLAAEYRLGDGDGIDFAGTTILGRLDRIDRRDGVLRVLDYKTSDKALSPDKAHLGPARAGVAEWAQVSYREKPQAWIDLQLPLYALLLAADPRFAGCQRIEVGYFNLPKDTASTGVELWHELDEAVLASARQCAERIVLQIREGQFWPPSERISFDEFAELSADSLAEAVDGTRFVKEVRHAY